MKKLVILLTILVVLSAFFNSGCAGQGQEFRPIVNDVEGLAGQCNFDMPRNTPIRGKCLIWNAMNNELSGEQSKLNSELQASPSDTEITVFLIVDKSNVDMGVYSISHQHGYQPTADIRVIYWPEKKVVGKHTVYGSQPVQKRAVQSSPSYGSLSGCIAHWINSLPRE